MRFVADENFSPRLARMLNIFDEAHEVEPITNYVAKGTPDVVWLEKIQTLKDKPLILCGDSRILKEPLARAALKRCNTHFIFLGTVGLRQKFEDQSWKIIKAWPGIVKEIRKTKAAAYWEFKFQDTRIERRFLISEL